MGRDPQVGAQNLPDWEEDVNSPISVTGDSSADITLNGTYDQVMVVLHDIRGSVSTSETLLVQINGDTGSNYHQRNQDGTDNIGRTDWSIAHNVPDAVSVSGSVLVSGRWTNGAGISNVAGGTEGGATLQSGRNPNVTAPLDSITVFWRDGTITGEIEVYGRNL